MDGVLSAGESRRWRVGSCYCLSFLFRCSRSWPPGRLRVEIAEMEWLQRMLPRLRATISDAERMQIKDEGFVLWLQEIKDVACDAEDVIDEFEYEELRSKVGVGDTWGSSWLSRSLIWLSRSLLPVSNMSMVRKINEIRKRIEDMAKESNGLRIEDQGGWPDQKGTQERMMQTSSLLKEGEVFGREREKEEIIEFLLASDDEVSPSTVAITGMGGLGKTTLVQLVYNDKRVEEHFHLKMWVCATPNYDVVKLTREILGSIGHDMQLLWGLENLDVYQRKLEEMLKGKCFLLVIDNMWDRDYNKWQNLLVPLTSGKKGSKVLITTRDTKVARILQTRKTVELEGLQFDDCWMLFKKHAFVDGNSGEYPRLEAVGKQMVEKFKGVPFAAVTMGGLMHSEVEESEWIRILESEIWEENGEDGILSVLKLSYDHLPPHLKQCYAYCSLVQKNYKFDKLELVQQWMAQGFVQTGGKGRMEDVGTEYFNDLFSRSFFQFADGKFVIHDLVHDLARLISHCDHSIIDLDGSHEILEDAHRFRHLTLLTSHKQPNHRSLEALPRYRGLRTLAFGFRTNVQFQIPHDLFLSLNALRVLDLSYGNIETLPDSIGALVHLRYLDLRRNTFRRLPKSLCHLYLLQTLKLTGCNYIEKLPPGISNLINLRRLEVEPHLLSNIVGIGKLTCLQELKSFPISKGHGIKVEDLKYMNELRALSIWNLHKVRSKEEATQAMLFHKQHLDKLELKWDVLLGRGNSKLEEVVLEALVPPPALKELSIKYYDGLKSPRWMEQQSMGKLESLWLMKCRNLNSLPLLSCLPFLKTIKVVDCPRLRVFPSLPTTLRELTIDNVGLEELPEFHQPPRPVPGSCNNISPSLSILRINTCLALKSLQQGLLRHHLRNLTVLSIQDCEQLVQWPEGDEFRATLLSLQKTLCLKDCPRLVPFPAGSTLSTSLKEFTVVNCPGVVNGPLFAHLQNLSSESNIYVRNGYANFYCSEEALQHEDSGLVGG